MSTEQHKIVLCSRLHMITAAWKEARHKCGASVQLFVGADFNRHDQMSGGDSVALSQRQGEGTPILEWMGDLCMHSMLPRGTKTFARDPHETTIDLALASDALARQMLKCQIHDVEHGSDHRTIVSVFSDARTGARSSPLPNFRKTDWRAVHMELEAYRAYSPVIDTFEDLEH